MRSFVGIVATVCLASCGSEQPAPETQAPPGMASEVTVELPPPAERSLVEVEEAGGARASYRLQEREPDELAAAWAVVLRRNDFPCDRILAARQLERQDGRAIGIYRIECADGGTYQGTRRDGRVRFRRWTGRI